MISHYATQGPGQHLLPGLEEATSDDNHLCSSVYSHSQTMTDPRSNVTPPEIFNLEILLGSP